MNSIKATLLLGLGCVLLISCASRTPTQYYDLSSQATGSDYLISEGITLGVGPVTLPQLLDRPGIVSRHDGTVVNVASYHVWAGELESTFTRVLTDSIATTLKHDKIWASPWDNRFRPEYQLRIFVDRFSGEVDGQVQLNLSWTLLSEYGKSVISTHRYQASLASRKGYQGYVSTLNQLLADFADQVAHSLVEELPE